MTEWEKSLLEFLKYCFEQSLLHPNLSLFQCKQEDPTITTFWVAYLPNLNVSITTDVRRTYFRCRIWNPKRGYDQSVVVGHELSKQSKALSWLPELFVKVWNAFNSPQNQEKLADLQKKIWN